jgi:hypothetical protein
MSRPAEIDRYVTEIPSFSTSSKRELETLSEPSTALTIPRARELAGRSHLACVTTEEPTANAVGEERLSLAGQIGDDELFRQLAAAVGTGQLTDGSVEPILDEGVERTRKSSDRVGLARVLRQCRLAYLNEDPPQALPLLEEAYRLAAESDYRVVADWALGWLEVVRGMKATR